MKIAYKHLVQNIEENPTIEELSNSLFQLGHEHEVNGVIFEMEFTPNRGDCLSVNGLLRDLSAFYNVNINQETYVDDIDDLLMDFENLSKDICPQISFLKIEIEKVPDSYNGVLDDYFSDLCLSKNNFFTDVSNYLSYESGQPTHCYDSNKINDKIIFQEVEEEYNFKTLLGKVVNLTEKNAVFMLNNQVINLAGVVGGESTACSSVTKTVLIECAFFQPESIIGKSVKYDIHSDAAHKFERRVDPECHDKVLRRFIKIVSDHATIKDMAFISHKYEDVSPFTIPVDVNKINKIIGINLSKDEYITHLLKLRFTVDNNLVKVPSFRGDVKTNNDLAEEVARIIGYNNILPLEIKIPNSKKKDDYEVEKKIRLFLLDKGFYEVINSPFVNLVSEGAITVDNPLDSNRGFLRTNIVNSLIDNLLYNERRQKDSIKLFEISDVYSLKNEIHKRRKLSIIASGRIGLNSQDFSKKINEKYLSNLFNEIFSGEQFNFQQISRDGLDTKLKSEIFSLEIEIKKLSYDFNNYKQFSASPKDYKKYKPISEFPSSYRDLSFLLEDPSKLDELIKNIEKCRPEFLKMSFMFDLYDNDKTGQTKAGFRFIFQSNNKTLTDKEIDVSINEIIKSSLEIKSVSIPGR